MTTLENEIKELILQTLDLQDLTMQQIDSTTPLFGDGLGLDSIDALELGIALQKRYGLALTEDNEKIREHFSNVRKLADFVASQTQVKHG